MSQSTSNRRPLLAGAAAALLVLPAVLGMSACSTGDEYRATIRRTSYGIPHITAADLGSLGFGEGYAHAEDHFCSLMDQVILARGERAKYFGRGENDAHINSDLTARALGLTSGAEADASSSNPELRDWFQGYVAGTNLWLEETGSENIPGWCAGEPWVGPVTVRDIQGYRMLVGLMASRFTGMIASAQPPGTVGTEGDVPSGAGAAAARLDLERVLAGPERSEMASNGWAIGSERAANGGGMLLANPHYPWEGSNRFWEKHLTIPGELDAYGVSLLGLPGVSIGFNEDIAWTHTVSAGQRFTLYSLELVPGKPTSYLYDGDERAMQERPVTIEVLADDGSLETLSRTLYFSHYGPILDWPDVGWTTSRVLSYRDANEHNDESLLTYLEMIRARNMDEFQRAHEEHQGILFVNTIATSKEGRAWYADVSAAPNLSAEAIAAWHERLSSDASTRALYDRGLLLLDGSDSRFEWVADPRARDAGVAPFAEVPQLERRDYVFNANDSYWLSNREALLEGYSPAHGPERTARSVRTRMNATTLSDTSPTGPGGEDGKFSLDELAAAALSNRSFSALLLKDELVARCQAQPSVRVAGERVDLGEACGVLAAWDGRYDLESRGAVLWREFITRYDGADFAGKGKLFAVDFDPDDAVATPRGLAASSLALENLGHAVRTLEGAGFAVDVPLGELQYSNKNNGRIPIHGGEGGWEGIENVVRYGPNSTTLEPAPEVAAKVEGSRFLTEKGYPVNYGTSFVMALELGPDGPHGQAFLTYSESGDWSSSHFTDQTKRFSAKAWRPILFREAEIAADPELAVLEVRGPRAAGS